jgi:uncharacterized protein (DUF58 family)
MGAAATLRQYAGGTLGRWARRRQGEDALPLTLLARRIYILPTRAGLAFALLLLAMLVAGLNYSNSVTLLLSFLLGGMVLIGIHECHRNLKGLRIVKAEVEDTFAGRSGRIELRFENTLPQPRSGLALRNGAAPQSRFELPPLSVCVHHLDYSAARRGRMKLGRIEIATTAPHGLFCAWSWLHLPLEAIVYPLPQGSLPLPGGDGPRARQAAHARQGGIDEWASLRPFVPGDSPRAVAWKLYARDAPLLVSQYESETGTDRVLDFTQLHGLGVEARLCQLTAWVLECARRGEAFALHLPRQRIRSGRGPEHQRHCLRALALFGERADGREP